MITFASITNKGGREVNEDSLNIVKIDENNACFILADGVGGHGRGDEASALAVKTAGEVFSAEYSSGNVLQSCFETAQEKILERQAELHTRNSMKTTLVILKITDELIQWGHIGDSRLYCFMNNKLLARTMDHSVPQMLAAAGEIKESEIRHHPDRNRLLRAMGEEWTGLKYDISIPYERTQGAAFLLCSDGFWELIEEKAMLKLLKKSNTAEEWLSAMTEAVKANTDENLDNYSAIAVFVDKEPKVA